MSKSHHALFKHLQNISANAPISKFDMEEKQLMNEMMRKTLPFMLTPQMEMLKHTTKYISKTTCTSKADLTNKEHLIRYNKIKHHLQQRGVKFVKRYSKDAEKTAEIDHESLLTIVSWTDKFFAESPKCTQFVNKYINNNKDCIMLYQITNHCMHQQSLHLHSVSQSLRHVTQRLNNVSKYGPFKLQIDDIPNFLQWMDGLSNDTYYHFCTECITQFWSDQQLVKLFLNYSSGVGFWTCGLITNFYSILG
eukprot:280973_1